MSHYLPRIMSGLTVMLLLLLMTGGAIADGKYIPGVEQIYNSY